MKQILSTDKIAAKKVNMDLWQSTKGNLFREEHLARMDSATHSKCSKCETIVEKYYTLCNSHSKESDNERYLKLEFKEWDRETPLVIYRTDIYFYDSDGIDDYCEVNEIEPKNLQLVICEPVFMRKIDEDYWQDYLGEDCELSKTMLEKLNEFNAFIEAQPPTAWEEGNFRTKYRG